jgi:hypothetical protein
MALGALIGIARDVVSRAIPPVMNYVTGKQGGAQSGVLTVSESNAATAEAAQRK